MRKTLPNFRTLESYAQKLPRIQAFHLLCQSPICGVACQRIFCLIWGQVTRSSNQVVVTAVVTSASMVYPPVAASIAGWSVALILAASEYSVA